MARIIKIQDILNLTYFKNQAAPMPLEKFVGKNIAIYDIQKGHSSKYDKIQYTFKVKSADGVFAVRTTARVICNQLTEILLKTEQLGYGGKSVVICKLAKENNNLIFLEPETREGVEQDVSTGIQADRV